MIICRFGMVARHWRGWTEVEKADAYERLLKHKVLPSLQRVEGYRGGYILRNDGPEEVEFAILNLFDSMEAVMGFAGSDYNKPVLELEARVLLRRFDPVAKPLRGAGKCQCLEPSLHRDQLLGIAGAYGGEYPHNCGKNC